MSLLHLVLWSFDRLPHPSPDINHVAVADDAGRQLFEKGIALCSLWNGQYIEKEFEIKVDQEKIVQQKRRRERERERKLLNQQIQ